MLIVFKAKGCADVIMLEENGREILNLFGREWARTAGTLTVEQLPDAIAALTRAVVAQRTSTPDAAGANANEDQPDAGQARVQLFQRAQPVLALLRQALDHQTPVIWGG